MITIPEKFDRCVREVRARSPNVNPYAVCTASIYNKRGVKNGKKKKEKNKKKKKIRGVKMTYVKPHLRKVKGRKTRVRVKGHYR